MSAKRECRQRVPSEESPLSPESLRSSRPSPALGGGQSWPSAPRVRLESLTYHLVLSLILSLVCRWEANEEQTKLKTKYLPSQLLLCRRCA
jgi:hypothetical protein